MLPRLRSVPGPQATMLPRLRSVPGPLSHLLGGHLGPALRLEVLLLHRCGSERVETLARSALLWRLPVASHRLLPVYELLPALNVLNGLPVVLDLALGLGEDLLQLVHLALQLGLKGELHVVECEGARGQLVHGCNTALASWKQGGVGGQKPAITAIAWYSTFLTPLMWTLRASTETRQPTGRICLAGFPYSRMSFLKTLTSSVWKKMLIFLSFSSLCSAIPMLSERYPAISHLTLTRAARRNTSPLR